MKHSFKPTGMHVLSWLGLAAMAAAQPVVWVTPSLQRTGQTDPAGSGTQAQIYAGKGEYESFQIIVRGPASGLTNVNVTVSNLTGPGGAVIPSSSFSLFSEHYVTVSPGSPNWGGSNQPLGAGTYPDGLIPFTDPNTGASLYNSGASLVAVPFNLNANVNQPIWVDLLVPQSATVGQYSGTFTVSSSQGSTSGTVSLTVWNFTLPVKSTLKSSFLYWNTTGLAADEELMRAKLEPIREGVSEQPTLMSSYGLSNVGLPFYSGADVSNCTMTAAPSVASIEASLASQTSGLSPYIYSADEIGACPSLYPTVQQWAYNMHQAGVNNLITMAPTTALFSDGSGSGRSAVDIWTMLPVTYNATSSSVLAQALAKGDSEWSYNALVQDAYSPKWEIDFAPINFRIQPGFISQSLGLSGLLYWKVDGWNTSNPWNQVNNTGTFSSANYPGEGQLVYPGTQVGISGVAPSMRLKWLRDGVEDYEYIAMLKAAGQGSQALALAQSVGANWTSWSQDPSLLASVRQQLGELLNSLNGGSSSSSSTSSSSSSSSTSSSSTSGQSTSSTTTTTTVPAKPVNPTPATGATGVSLTATLSWGAVTGATSYQVYFGSSTVSLVATVTGTSYTPGTLAANTAYTWGIVAVNSTGSNSSATWTFTTGSTVTSPSLSSSSVPSSPLNPTPATGATGVSLTPTLSWGAVTGATSYQVYLGSSTVSLVATVAGTTYVPSALAANTVYTWGVVALNSAGSNSSATWTFTTGSASSSSSSLTSPPATTSTGASSAGPGVAPFVASAIPGAGTGMTEVLTLTYSDANGYTDIAGAGAMIASSVSGANACWFYYNSATSSLSLANNSGTAWSALPSGGSVANSQCTINSATATGSGNAFTLTVSITYSSTFAGTQNVYGYVQSNEGLSSSYQYKGTWIVP